MRTKEKGEPLKNEKLIDDFVETWGNMGRVWGINNSVARVHGLLIITDRPWCIDEIVERLMLSKSNVSTSLKELRSWNVVKRTFKPGDRREFYSCEPNAWEMIFNIARQRKKLEFDPILAGITDTYKKASENPSGIALERLTDMKNMLDLFNKLAEMALASESQVKSMISLFVGAGG